MSRILVIGNGFLGSNMFNEAKENQFEVYGTHCHSKSSEFLPLDITNKKSIIDCFDTVKPHIVINCAANTDVDFLEKNPNIAYAVNSDAVKNLAKISNDFNSKLIYISTDSVFDGKRGMYVETDLTNPVNVYAKSKIHGEKFVQDLCKNYLILRTNFYGNNKEGKYLFNWIVSNLKNNKTITGFDDVIFNPLEVSNLSKMILEISITNHTGIFHLSSNQVFSKYQFALKIAEHLGKSKDLIKPGSIKDLKLPAKRPKNTTLNNKKSKKVLHTPILSLDDWLKQSLI